MPTKRRWHYHKANFREDEWAIYRGQICPGRGYRWHSKKVGTVRKVGERRFEAELFGHLADNKRLRGVGRTRTEAIADALIQGGIPHV